MSDLQHCAACREEYVAGVAACVECGQPLQAGPLPRGSSPARGVVARRDDAAGGDDDAAPARSDPPLDRLLAELPGLQADQTVRALLLEGIACRVECEGIRKVYRAGQPPTEAFAVTLPVSIYVGDATYESAQEIAQSLAQEDVIGDQWSATPAEDEPAADAIDAEADVDAETEADVDAADESSAASKFAYDHFAGAPDSQPPLSGPVAEGTALRTVVLIVLAGIALLVLFAR